MVSAPSDLSRLAGLAGVATTYEDVFGRTHAVAERTLRAVLAALGFDASDDLRAAAALAAFEARAWRRGVEPVYVAPALEAVRVTFTRPSGPDARVRWVLRGENDAAGGRAGETAASACPLLATGEAEGRTYERRALPLAAHLEPGYYQLSIDDGDTSHATTLIVVPERCHLPERLERRGIWGLAVQVYALRSASDWGAGDYGDLRALCEVVRDAGGGAVGVNPLHLLSHGGSSPYAPSSRRFTNWALLDVRALPGFAEDDLPAQRIATSRARDLIAYDDLSALKLAAARQAFERFVASGADARFEDFVRSGGAELRAASLFFAIARDVGRDAPADDWRTWPEAFRDPASPAVAAFATSHSRELAFSSYLQWQIDMQLAAVASACDGMPVGLYRDLAVGTQLGGLDTWVPDGALSTAAGVGAPPDLLNVAGQDWGVAPFDPLALREAAYAPFVALVRANVRHAGALRIDHVMGLLRLWWVPAGFGAAEGAYVHYRLDELLGILALESVRARCTIVGEDLGTVPPGFRERLEEARVLSYRVLQFEADDERFFAPDEYPPLALVTTGTHDLPTMAAYWSGSDIGVREAVGALPDAAAVAAERVDRERKRAMLREAFAGADIAFEEDGDGVAVGLAATCYLAQTPGRLLMVQLEDVLGETEQINMPATVDEHPNWRRRSGVRLDALATDARFVAFASALRETRGIAADARLS